MENFVATDGSTHTALDSPRQLWSIAGYIGLTRSALLGINYEQDGIRFAPVVPASMLGSRSLKGLKYRGMTLDITVIGEGSIIKSFTLDGEKAEPFIPSTLKGEHKVMIVMTGDWYAPEDVINVKPVQWDVDNPRVKVEEGKLVWAPVKGAAQYQVLLDGHGVATLEGTSFDIKDPGEYVVIAKSLSGAHSFMSEPVRVGLGEFSIPCETTLTTKRGTQLKLILVAPSTNTYLIDFNYSNGNGDLSTFQKCATRTLYIDGKKVDAVVMPQRGTDWNETGWTAPARIELTAGEHTLELRYPEENVNMDIDTDNAVVHQVRLSYKIK